VTIWTFAFAIISVASTFFLGLFLAIVFNDARMRGRKWYRVGMILPYAFPAFLSTLIWAGMMNQSFGFINQVLFGGASIPWLTDPTLAKFSVLLVNLWLGFPYMFLICTGALQSIPEELGEAATVDGASPWAIFRLIKLPLLLVTVAPMLIASFAFNFNNFIVIYALTNGGPRDINAPIPVGYTDILISMVYKVAFTGQNRDYGLASAFSILIFIIVAVIAIISFRRTKALEDLN
jgi:arabinogalactan oligomer/maltooligosaccharide transport system permease protein